MHEEKKRERKKEKKKEPQISGGRKKIGPEIWNIRRYSLPQQNCVTRSVAQTSWTKPVRYISF